MTKVKICGLTNLEDARWAASCGADLLGFIFVPSSPRYVVSDRAARIMAALRAEGTLPRFVGVFANAPLSLVQEVLAQCPLDFVQLHGKETPAYAQELGAPVIRAHRVDGPIPWDQLVQYEAWAYLLDSYDARRLGGTGHRWRWDLLDTSECRAQRIILAGGLTPGNVGLAVQQIRPWGVDVSSGVEAAPGRKDAVKVKDFVKCAKSVKV